jgi:tetratricopeptide (TPR) repeat protein
MEDHDRAYYAWKDYSVKDRVLVHIDAHMDFAWFSQDDPAHILEAKTLKDVDRLINSVNIWNPSPDQRDTAPDIGNYICSAIREGIVREFIWVVPDDFLDTRRKFIYWKQRIERVLREIPRHKSKVVIEGSWVRTRFYDCPVTVCTASGMPDISGNPVLLDIDVDFFVTDFERQENIYLLQIKKRLPWMWPRDLIEILKGKGLKSDLATISYSVEKYFTPLEFKYLGDELKTLLSGQPVSDAARDGFEFRRLASERKANGFVEEAVSYLEKAVQCGPAQASDCYNLALLLYEKKDFDRAGFFYQKAIRLDERYRTGYNNLAILYDRLGLTEEMEEEYKKTLILDPQSICAQAGMAEVYFIKGDRAHARVAAENVLAREPRHPGAKYLLAEIFLQERKFTDAAKLLEEVVELDPGHLYAYLTLAKLYASDGKIAEAISHYKTAWRLGFCDTALFFSLSLLYFNEGSFAKALRMLGRGLRLFPLEVFESIMRSFQKSWLLKSVLN